MKLINMLLAVILIGAAVVETCADDAAPVYPGNDWTKKRPEQVGLNAKKLKELSNLRIYGLYLG